MQAPLVAADRFEDRVGADDVRADERLGIVQRVVDVRLGREVDHHLVLGDQPIDELGIADVAMHEADSLAGRGEALAITRRR